MAKRQSFGHPMRDSTRSFRGDSIGSLRESEMREGNRRIHLLDLVRDGIDETSFAWQNLLGQPTVDTWTPTLTNTTNLDSTTAVGSFYIDLGVYVICFGRFAADPTATGNTEFQMSLPIASTLGEASQCAGGAWNSNTAGESVRVSANTITNEATFGWNTNRTSNGSYSFIFIYLKQ